MSPTLPSDTTPGSGPIDITRSAPELYSVRFAGLGRTPGQRDNVQVRANNATSPVICKPNVWDASAVDLRVTVSCFSPDGAPIDSRFTILVAGAWAFGRTASLGFALSFADSGAIALDSSATARNSTGRPGYVGRVAEGSFSVRFQGLEAAWAAGPVAVAISPVGQGPRRCRLIAVDPSMASLGVNRTRPGGGPGDSPFSVLWLQHGRPSMRFGFAWAQNAGVMADSTPDPAYLINSSGGSVKARKTGPGHYRVVFAGLGRPANATEIVLVSPFLFSDRICDITSWGSTGASDLFVDVACFDPSSTPVDTRFSVLVTQQAAGSPCFATL